MALARLMWMPAADGSVRGHVGAPGLESSTGLRTGGTARFDFRSATRHPAYSTSCATWQGRALQQPPWSWSAPASWEGCALLHCSNSEQTPSALFVGEQIDTAACAVAGVCWCSAAQGGQRARWWVMIGGARAREIQPASAAAWARL